MSHCPHCKAEWEKPSPPKCRVVCSECKHLVWPPEYNIPPSFVGP